MLNESAQDSLLHNSIHAQNTSLIMRSTQLGPVAICIIFSYSLVDGGGLRTFLCDPMHTLRSSGYTLSGICIDNSWVSANVHTLAKKKLFQQPFCQSSTRLLILRDFKTSVKTSLGIGNPHCNASLICIFHIRIHHKRSRSIMMHIMTDQEGVQIMMYHIKTMVKPLLVS